MKKNIFYSFIVAILLSSCQGMDLMPADKMSDGDYWLTENDFKIYANGLYPSLMKFNGDDNLAQYDQKADLSTSYFGFNSVSNGRWLPSESDGVWDDCYAYLRKIHILLEHVDACILLIQRFFDTKEKRCSSGHTSILSCSIVLEMSL